MNLKQEQEMKTIYLSDLAQQYFPHSTPKSAVTQLHRWLKINPEQPNGWKSYTIRRDSGRLLHSNMKRLFII